MINTQTFKFQSLYIAFVPQTGVWAAGGCLDEAVNGLSEQLRASAAGAAEQGTVHEGAAQP
jgi:hypothetical protein